MHKLASAAIAAALVGVMAIPAPASAATFSFSVGASDRFVSDRCDRHPDWRGCDDWRDNRRHWSRSDYQRWYRWNQPNIGNVAAGIFGFAVGAAIVNNLSRSGSDWADHVDACEDAYKSYSARTDMYLGYDGDYHRCRL